MSEAGEKVVLEGSGGGDTRRTWGEEERAGEVEWLRAKVEGLQREWDSQQEHLARLQGELFAARNQVHSQSSFSSRLGAVMGHLLWKASRHQPVVALLLSTNRVSEFLSMVTGTLVSFVETYADEVPDMKSEETQFVVSMGGVVANMAAAAEGRQFIVTSPEGRLLVDSVVKLLPAIPEVSGDPVKRILLMCLYNLSLNQNGVLLLQDRKPLLQALSSTVASQRTPELRLIALRLLDSLTAEIVSPAVLNLVTYFLPLTKIQSLYECGDPEIRHFTTNIIDNLARAQQEKSKHV